uniref:phycobilisome degradation protein n=1 Tax=Galdieria phlegrea TaxID=1389228 RepID=UPI0023D7F941|nr:phycobilisome degradation protein [Galdieria phlegrea]WDA99851.1 phycobilisome degradation protein [Galdieria phlegrea]
MNSNYNSYLGLSLEQEFKLKLYSQIVDTLNETQKKKLLLEILKCILLNDNILKYLIKYSNFK